MQNLLIYLTEVSLCMTLFYLFYCFLLQKQAAFQWNRCFLLTASVTTLVLPLLQIPIAPHTIAAMPIGSYWLQTISIEAEATHQLQQHLGFVEVLTIVYFTGVFLFSIRLLGQLWSFGDFIKKHPIGISEKGYYIIETQQLPTFSFFKYLVINIQDLPQLAKEQILLHEEAHIEQQHSWDILLMELLKVIFWFNPIVYLYQQKLQEIHEYLADSVVLKHYPDSLKNYAQLIVQQAIHCNVIQISNHFSKHQIKKRILMMKNTQTQTHRLWSYLLSIPLLGLSILLFSCTETNPIEAQTPISLVVADNDDKDKILEEVEQMPEYEGGFEGLINFLSDNIKYPESARKARIEGKTFVSFVINQKGEVTNPKITKGFDADCDAEALRAVSAMPNWIPGKDKGEVVKVLFTLPISFMLE
ncbi:MAG: TonB family protein [Chitinophagales bacterium]